MPQEPEPAKGSASRKPNAVDAAEHVRKHAPAVLVGLLLTGLATGAWACLTGFLETQALIKEIGDEGEAFGAKAQELDELLQLDQDIIAIFDRGNNRYARFANFRSPKSGVAKKRLNGRT